MDGSKKDHRAHRYARVQRLDQPVRVGGREVGEDDDEGEDELEAEVGDGGILEMIFGPMDPMDKGRACDGPATLGAHVQGGSERFYLL